MQGDGNLVLYRDSTDPRGHAAWATGTEGTDAQVLIMQDDGNLVLYAAGKAVWAMSLVDPHAFARFRPPLGMVRARCDWPRSPEYNDRTQEGFYNLNFYLRIDHEAPSHFWAHQFFFVDGDGGYMGLQSDGQ